MEQEKSRVFPLLISVGEREYLHRESFSHNMSVSNYVKSLVLPKNYESRLVKLRKENSASDIKPHLRWRNHYAPGKLILSRSRNFNVDVLIDDNDLEIIKKYQWHYTGGYVSTFVKLGKGKFTSKTLHQILNPTWNMTDHIDRNPRNNQRSNLRPCTSSENARNHKISKKIEFLESVDKKMEDLKSCRKKMWILAAGWSECWQPSTIRTPRCG